MNQLATMRRALMDLKGKDSDTKLAERLGTSQTAISRARRFLDYSAAFAMAVAALHALEFGPSEVTFERLMLEKQGLGSLSDVLPQHAEAM